MPSRSQDRPSMLRRSFGDLFGQSGRACPRERIILRLERLEEIEAANNLLAVVSPLAAAALVANPSPTTADPESSTAIALDNKRQAGAEAPNSDRLDRLFVELAALKCSFAYTCPNTSRYGQTLASDTHTFRTVTRTYAPIFSNHCRIEPHGAFANDVPARPKRRTACTNPYANELNHKRNWLLRNHAVLVRSANNINCCSLMRFSISPRAQYVSSYSTRASCCSADSDVTTKRGFAPLGKYSAWPTTRRVRLQLSRKHRCPPCVVAPPAGVRRKRRTRADSSTPCSSRGRSVLT